MSTLSARRPLSIFAVLAMVASMLFVAAGPAQAALPVPTSPALFQACPGNADGFTAGAFSDMGGNFAAPDADCMAYFGVSNGIGGGLYDPFSHVTRWQMALFLTRLAGPAGVVLPAAPPDAGFTDIGHLDAATQLAINQLAALGITIGTGPGTFSPDFGVVRQDMALFLYRFLLLAVTGPGGTAPGGALLPTPFSDLASVSVAAAVAISQLFDMAITTGATATTYNPLGWVQRDEMGAFLNRTAAHTNARPMGVNIQASPSATFGGFTTTLSVTGRDTSFQPLANKQVDVFQHTHSVAFPNTGDAISSTTGLCVPAAITDSSPGGFGDAGAVPCGLALGDPELGPTNGNLATVTDFVADGETITYYAWGAHQGFPLPRTFDNIDNGILDTTYAGQTSFDYSMVTVTSTGAPTTFSVTSDAPPMANKGITYGPETVVPFGTPVTWTIQLLDAAGNPVAQPGVVLGYTDALTVDGSPISTVSLFLPPTNAAGQTFYTVAPVGDPDPIGVDNVAHNALTVDTGSLLSGPTTFTTHHDDDAQFADLLDLDDPTRTWTRSTTTWYELSAEGAPNTVTATVWDQYGNPLPGVPVEFDSFNTDADIFPKVGPEGIGTTDITRTTNAQGVATLTYTWDAAESAREVTFADTVAGSAPGDFFMVLWVDKATTADDFPDNGGEEYAFWGVDRLLNTLVLAEDDPVGGCHNGCDFVLYYFDANDNFKDQNSPALFTMDKWITDILDPVTGTFANWLGPNEVNPLLYETSAASVSSWEHDDT